MFQLIKKDQIKRYKKSVLGYAWSVLNPLLTMMVMVMVFSQIFDRKVENFPIYLITGQLMFNMMSESSQIAMNSITGNASLIQKVYMPKYIFPLSSICSSLYNQMYSLIALLIVMLATSYVPPKTIFLFIIPLFYQYLFCVGWGLILSTLMVFFRDMRYIYRILITLWTYMTPIFYTADALPEYTFNLIKTVNPMYHFITYMRTLILDGKVPGVRENLICFSFGFGFLVVGLLLFYKKQDRFVEYI